MNGLSPLKAKLLEAHPISWEFGFNDATFIGWATVAAYVIAGAFAWRAAGRANDRFDRTIWLAISLAMLSLAINKQLDLHVLITDIGRFWAIQNDLYQQRRGFQKLFMLAVAAGVAGLTLAGVWFTRGRDPALRLALAGVPVSAGYMLVRAASFHHTDVLMRTTLFGLRWNWTIEVAGIGLTALGAARYRARAR